MRLVVTLLILNLAATLGVGLTLIKASKIEQAALLALVEIEVLTHSPLTGGH